jgi:uncharacterized membrane protein
MVKPRIQSVDALRGLIMIVMALDHTRDFFHADALVFRPEDLTRATPALFFTRWITHFCAPVFMFTAGLGAYFWLNRGGQGRTRPQLSQFLLTRGLWLAFLDLAVVHFAVSLGKGPIILTPLWGLGWAMVALALLIYIPTVPLAVLSVAVIASHNLLDGIPATGFGPAAWLWNCLHQLGVFKVHGTPVLISYPFIPWFAVMSAGYCFGNILILEPAKRRQWTLRIGLALTLAFLIIRTINVYGDPAPWSGNNILSFLRCNKYPPSLDFLLMTLGPALMLLAWLDRCTFSPANPLLVFGRVPLFYFVVHLFALHLLAVRRTDNLAVVYLIWIAVVTALYPVCRWFANLKQQTKATWLSYL